MMIRAAQTAVLAGIAILALGCSLPSGAPGTASAPASVVATSSAEPAAGGAEAGLVIAITIEAGTVEPTNATLAARVGAPITLRVDSDAGDELHVHSVPEHTFAVAARPDQRFEFTVDVPGRVEIEVHHLDRTVATIQVQP